jgi:hypothetical protein
MAESSPAASGKAHQGERLPAGSRGVRAGGERALNCLDNHPAVHVAYRDAKALGVFAEFEINIRKERQMEGMRNAMAEGRYRGRPSPVDGTEVRETHARGMGPAAP